jgi:hypothetical protein
MTSHAAMTATMATTRSMIEDCTALAPRSRARQTPANAATITMSANSRSIVISLVRGFGAA